MSNGKLIIISDVQGYRRRHQSRHMSWVTRKATIDLQVCHHANPGGATDTSRALLQERSEYRINIAKRSKIHHRGHAHNIQVRCSRCCENSILGSFGCPFPRGWQVMRNRWRHWWCRQCEGSVEAGLFRAFFLGKWISTLRCTDQVRFDIHVSFNATSCDSFISLHLDGELFSVLCWSWQLIKSYSKIHLTAIPRNEMNLFAVKQSLHPKIEVSCGGSQNLLGCC